MKKKIRLVLSVLLLYLLLLVLLVLAEKNSDSVIQTLEDAVWYSLVTVTTVGYGDVYPVTTAGKMVGVVFVLLGVGFFSTIIGVVISLLGGKLTGFILWKARKKDWFIFSMRNDCSNAIANQLKKEYPGALFIFCNAENGARGSGSNTLCISGGVGDAVLRTGHAAGKRRAFFVSGDSRTNLEEAGLLSGQEIEKYCLGDPYTEDGTIGFFEPCQNTARLYWKQHPLKSGETTVLLIGDGAYAAAMLNTAVTVCCRQPFFQTKLVAFGNWREYRMDHYSLESLFSSDPGEKERDVLCFRENWNADPGLLFSADRIILCGDSPEGNGILVDRLRNCFPLKAQIYVRSGAGGDGPIGFGRFEEIFTGEMVMNRQLDRLSAAMHEHYIKSTGGGISWERLNRFYKDSNRSVGDHMDTKIRLLTGQDLTIITRQEEERAAKLLASASPEMRDRMRRNEHERWCRFYALHNWTWAETRDDAARRHPCMTSFDELDEKYAVTDDYVLDQIGCFAAEREKTAL